MSAIWTFDRFEPGTSIGTMQWTPDRAAFAQWNALFRSCPSDQATLPPGMIAMVALRAYMHLLSARPPGNIHTMQRTRIVRLPAIGEPLETELRCLSKEIKKGRRWVRFATITGTRAGEACFNGEMTMLWAA